MARAPLGLWVLVVAACQGEKGAGDCEEVSVYLDADGDGFGDGDGERRQCLGADEDPAAGLTRAVGDCDDADATVSPGAEEVCDGIDQDCDGIADNDPTDGLSSFRDADGDGYGDITSETRSCARPADFIARGGDCDDADPDRHPGVVDDCDDLDSNCDGVVDDAGSTWYIDNDNDGFGASRGVAGTCEPPVGYVAEGTDCDDSDETVYPGAEEVCGDGQVNDCDGSASHALSLCEAASAIDLGDADAELYGENATDEAGYSLAAGADLDGDGRRDLLVGAPGNNSLGSVGADAGKVYIVGGDAMGDTPLSGASASLLGVESNDQAGVAVAIAGDMDRDGYDDLVVGAPGVGPDGDSAGKVYVVEGPVTGSLSLEDATAVLEGEAALDGAGASVAGLGDLNGDGRADFLVGAPGWDGTGEDAGAAYLVLGPITGSLDLSRDALIVPGWREGNQTGASVAAAGDVDGDGLTDVLIGAPTMDHRETPAGAAYLISGPVVGLADLRDSAAFLEGEAGGALGGWAVAGGSDLNGDGYDDVVIGAPHESWFTQRGGAAYIVEGPVSDYLHLSFASARILGENPYDYAGSAVAAGGDMDGDGFGDVIVGVYGVDNGAAYVVTGPTTGSTFVSWTDLTLKGERTDAAAGWAVSFAGDVNADGLDDLLIGAPRSDHGRTATGIAFLVYGLNGAY